MQIRELSIEMGETGCIMSNTEISIPQDSSTNVNNHDSSTKTLFETVWKSDIVSVLLTKTYQQQKNIMQIVKQATALQLRDANGTAKSFIQWGCKCNLDNHQRCIFEVIMASFVLTYFKVAGKNNEEMTNT